VVAGKQRPEVSSLEPQRKEHWEVALKLASQQRLAAIPVHSASAHAISDYF
jgi:hypothetical protein